MSKSFGTKDLRKCLKKLGFIPKGIRSSHVKYCHKEKKVGSNPFIIVQLGKKTYGKNASSRYISQVKQFGFSKEEIEKDL